MQAWRSQQTIRHVCHVSGRGYWSGRPVTLAFLPAAPGTGIVFQRIDLPDRPEIRANVSNRRDAQLRTRLVSGDADVEMVEHVLAALFAMQIDNCIVQCDASEMPGLDGSALPYALALDRAGTLQQTDGREIFGIQRRSELELGNQNITALPADSQGLQLEYHLDYGDDSVIRASRYTMLLTPENFINHIAPARTFILHREAKELQARGLASHVTFRDLLVFDDSGPIDNTLRFPDECTRHKMLDLIGDLALAGCELRGRIIARRSGHMLNGRMAEQLNNERYSSAERSKVA